MNFPQRNRYFKVSKCGRLDIAIWTWYNQGTIEIVRCTHVRRNAAFAYPSVLHTAATCHKVTAYIFCWFDVMCRNPTTELNLSTWIINEICGCIQGRVWKDRQKRGIEWSNMMRSDGFPLMKWIYVISIIFTNKCVFDP